MVTRSQSPRSEADNSDYHKQYVFNVVNIEMS